MKKVILSLALLVASISTVFAAAPSKYATIAMGASEITVAERADWSDAFDNGYDAYAYNPKGLAIVSGGQRYAAWATNDLSEVELEIALDAPVTADVTLTFSNVIGEIHLNIDGTDVLLADGGSVVIPAADFGTDGKYSKSLKVNPAAPATPKALIEGSKLQITGFAGKKAKVTDAKGAVIEDEKELASDNETINLDAQPAGRYVLILDGQPYQFDIKIPEIPEAKYHVVTAQP